MAQKREDEVFVAKVVSRSLWGVFFLSLGALAIVVLKGPISVVVPVPIRDIGSPFHFRLDELTTLLFVMVSLLFSGVARYSRSYLVGEPTHGVFFLRLLVLFLTTSLFLFSQNLLVMFLCWVSMSFALHSLLLFYPDRPRARAAASKKFFVSRLGDLFLLVAFGLLFRKFGTLDLTELISVSRTLGPEAFRASGLPLISLLIATGALIKSAQVPFHFWLPESMETPTPVSAIMHAGIINAGGVLLIRLSPLMEHATEAHTFVAIAGAVSAVYGALVMMTQNDIKRKLAYSTISQMGLMMFACGIGALSLAVVHIIAHSLYKAHGFLTTGSLVEESRKITWRSNGRGLTWAFLTPIFGGLILLWASIFAIDQLSLYAYAGVILLGAFESPFLFSDWKSKRPAQLWIGFLLVSSMALAIGVETGLSQFLREAAPFRRMDGAADLAVVWICYLLFSLGFFLAWVLREKRGVWVEKIYVFLWNGGYFSLVTTRALNHLSGVWNPRKIVLEKET